VTLDRAGGDEEGLGDLAVGEALAGELGDPTLARCERVDPGEHDSAWARASGAELGLGKFREGPGAGAVGGVQCLAKEPSRLGSPIAPPQQGTEISEGSSSLQGRIATLEYVDRLTK
jgi:hypothetical protein